MIKFLIIIYGIFLLFFTIFSYAFVDPNLSYLKDIYSGFALNTRLLTTTFYILFVLIFFVFYGIFIWRGISNSLKFKEVIVLLGITVGILFFSYPAMLSYDIFNYIATSKVLFFYHENPYVVMPIEFLNEPFLSFTRAANKIALYGPVWIVLTGIPYFLGIGNFIITLFSFKLLVIVFYFATIFLVWRLSKSILTVVLFAFNPLVLIETIVGGHNDIVMILFMLFSFFLLMRKKVFFAILLFILSVLIKYSTVLLIPIFLYFLWQIIKKKEINWKNIFYYSSILMFVGFLLSPIREEIYPWYAIWFIPFIFLNLDRRFLINVSIVFSFSLLLRYVPYIFTGTYGNLTPILKEVISFSPPILYCIYYVFKKKI